MSIPVHSKSEDLDLSRACLLALLKGTGRLGKSVKSLTLKPNLYFDKFDLPSDLQGVEYLQNLH